MSRNTCPLFPLPGHLLGMGHDGSVGCDWSEYIMSRSRAVHGQTSWSSCSKASLASQSVLAHPCQEPSLVYLLVAGAR